jgi:hypothetical protein
MNYFNSISTIKRSLLILSIVLWQSCKKDNEIYVDPNSMEAFYDNAFISAKENDLMGDWNFTSVELNGETLVTPPSMEYCGYDFFSFFKDNVYREITYVGYSESSSNSIGYCDFKVDNYSWELKEGIITLTEDESSVPKDSITESEELVVVSITDKKLVAKVRLDVDNIGEYNVFTVTAEKYIPPLESELNQTKIVRNHNIRDKLQLNWEVFNGYNKFIKYEIFRSLDQDKSTAKLAATITDVNENKFNDLHLEENSTTYNYYLKIHTEAGIIEGESSSFFFRGNDFNILQVELLDPIVTDDSIELKWENYEGYYFSHHEITVRNFENTAGYRNEEISVAIIHDVNTVNFIVENTPYFTNPIYSVYTYNIFGARNYTKTGVNSQIVNFKRPEILDFITIDKIAVSTDQPVLYFYGKKSKYGEKNIFKYNYSTLETEAFADVKPITSESSPLKLINDELCYKQGDEIFIYDANTLEYKEKISATRGIYFQDYIWLKDDIWILTDSDKIHSFRRSQGVFTLIDSKDHYTIHHHYTITKIIQLNKDEVLVGYQDEEFCFKFKIDNEGGITEKSIVNIPLRTSGNSYVNENLNILVNTNDNTSYKLSDASKNTSIITPEHIAGISLVDFDIYGTNNKPNSSFFDSYEKKAQILFSDGTLKVVETKGYPLFMFKDYLGKVMSISSGLKRDDLKRSSPKNDIFIEVVE